MLTIIAAMAARVVRANGELTAFVELEAAVDPFSASSFL
jgi:hypothetical protein